VVPVENDPHWLVGIEILSVEKPEKPFDKNGKVVLLIHSPARLFAGEEKAPGKTYLFKVPGTMRNGRPVFYSAWYSESRQEVLVIDQTKPGALRIGGFPKDYGRIATTGWKDGRFFVHVQGDNVESGFMIYRALKTKQATEVKHWAAW